MRPAPASTAPRVAWCLVIAGVLEAAGATLFRPLLFFLFLLLLLPLLVAAAADAAYHFFLSSAQAAAAVSVTRAAVVAAAAVGDAPHDAAVALVLSVELRYLGET